MYALDQTVSIDEKAITAKQSKDQLEQLIAEFTPFLRRRLAKYAVHIRGAHQKEDMFSIIMTAFYEAVMAFDAQKGRFIPFADRVICARMIDHLRKFYRNERMTAPAEIEGAAPSALPAAISKISMDHYKEERENALLAEELEQFVTELGEWGITIEQLTRRSPKHERLLGACRDIVSVIAQDPEIMRTVQKKHYLPIKAIAELTGEPYKKLERLRTYLLAALIVKTGDYQYISGYI